MWENSKLIITIILLFTAFIIVIKTARADNEIDYKYIDYVNETIQTKCFENSWSWELYFEDNMWLRCTLILQAISQFETNFLRDYHNNNIFNFRWWEWMKTVKEKWKNLWVIWYSNRFLKFDSIESSISFAVDRFYTYDRYKTIKMIIFWWSYISPITWELKVFDWFTMTKADRPNYYNFLKKYYNENYELWEY